MCFRLSTPSLPDITGRVFTVTRLFGLLCHSRYSSDMELPNLTELTDYQLRFVDSYMRHGDKRRALLDAGYSGNGKDSNITSVAYQLMNNPKVRREIEKRQNELNRKSVVDSSQIIERLLKMFNGELTSREVTREGKLIDVPISFKNQIDAAKVLVSILQLQAQVQGKPEENRDMKRISDDLKALTDKMLERNITPKKKKK